MKEATPSVVSSIERLYSNQEEADTRMILHASSLSRDHETIIIQCDDTGVLVLLVYYFSRGHLSDHEYTYAGHSGKERYIPVDRIANELGQTVCECSMNRIGKKTSYSKLLKNVDTLSNLKTFHEDDLEHSVAVARSYALLLYEKKGSDMDTLDELRYIMATTTDKSASMLPPTEDAFKQHVLRAKYQTRIWCNSHMPNEEVIEPVIHGWTACDDGGITQTMFTQASAPVEVRDLTYLYCTDKDCLNARKCPCLLVGLECIDACSCTGCSNQNNKPEGDDGKEMDTDV